ncbi:hypothetical protein [Mycobacterium sp.]|uniref:hypothetical protein n=1 Tax=Mycobacterium sp. TaxID=1785 RepID=UPI003F9BAB71
MSLCHHHGAAVADGGLAGALAHTAGGNGIHRLLLKGVHYLLEAEEFDCWLVNAREVKNAPGRAKTLRADAVWLAKVAERGMCRPSLVHPPEIRRLRDLTLYRRGGRPHP